METGWREWNGQHQESWCGCWFEGVTYLSGREDTMIRKVVFPGRDSSIPLKVLGPCASAVLPIGHRCPLLGQFGARRLVAYGDCLSGTRQQLQERLCSLNRRSKVSRLTGSTSVLLAFILEVTAIGH